MYARYILRMGVDIHGPAGGGKTSVTRSAAAVTG
jgi:hypothetical protein